MFSKAFSSFFKKVFTKTFLDQNKFCMKSLLYKFCIENHYMYGEEPGVGHKWQRQRIARPDCSKPPDAARGQGGAHRLWIDRMDSAVRAPVNLMCPSLFQQFCFIILYSVSYNLLPWKIYFHFLTNQWDLIMCRWYQNFRSGSQFYSLCYLQQNSIEISQRVVHHIVFAKLKWKVPNKCCSGLARSSACIYATLFIYRKVSFVTFQQY
jgi:hypothetical protein